MPTNLTGSIIRVIFEKAFNQGNFATIEALLAPASITHITAWGLPNNRNGFKQLIASFRFAFPDLHCVVEDEIQAGDKVAAHWTMRGTHTGSFFGSLPTGRAIEVHGILFARTADQQVIECWLLVDQFGMLQQLGVVPPPKSIQGKKEISS